MSNLPDIKVPYPGPEAKKVIEFCKKYESTGLKSFKTSEPLVFSKSKGALLEDPDGNVYLDLFGSYAVANLGHCNEDVVKAIKSQSE